MFGRAAAHGGGRQAARAVAFEIDAGVCGEAFGQGGVVVGAQTVGGVSLLPATAVAASDWRFFEKYDGEFDEGVGLTLDF